MLPEALLYFEKAAQLGDPNGVKVAQMTRQMMNQEPASQANPTPQANSTQQAFKTFVAAGSLDEMISAVGRFPFMFMVQDEFMAAVADVIQKQVPAEQRPYFEQRFAWLRAIAQAMKG